MLPSYGKIQDRADNSVDARPQAYKIITKIFSKKQTKLSLSNNPKDLKI
jgi:hypothetical protein